MLKYDSVHGRFEGEVAVEDGALIVNGNKIRLTAEMDPANLKWNEVDADVVVESTGFFLTDETWLRFTEERKCSIFCEYNETCRDCYTNA